MNTAIPLTLPLSPGRGDSEYHCKYPRSRPISGASIISGFLSLRERIEVRGKGVAFFSGGVHHSRSQ